MPRPRAPLILLATVAIPGLARADGGLSIGGRAGVQLLDDNALGVGADVRLSFDLSPLIVNLAFDQFFVEDATLFQVSANALYDLPLATSVLSPFAGAGMSVTRFAVAETPGVQDASGMRIGLNLVAGLRFEHEALPVARPFAQVVVTLGPIDLVTIGGGVLFELAGG